MLKEAHTEWTVAQGYLEKGIQTPVAQGRSTKIISMIMWTRTSRLSIKISLSGPHLVGHSFDMRVMHLQGYHKG